jgi:Tfp pilus assembly protein PilF
MYFLNGEPGKAEESFRRALELDPNLVSARYHLARLLQANQQPVSAAEEYRRVVDWDSTGLYRDRALAALSELGE